MVVTFLVALLAWIVISLGAGIGLGRMMARAETEDGRVPPLAGRTAGTTAARL
ncbi:MULTISPECIES: hypothetical protein [Microbacterium]|jgi:hypothetical protein|uniref:hypothetical protein n=1 Tax=Microbacterium TaxID=33882 RepID=UPI0023DB4FB0|nr:MULTISPECIES: hypothetical protein [Microbacterium]MDF2045876.1 hypothetical protein [Microbacterium sp. Kw_RZR3]MDQ1074292.1 hypothetical protein [Microbacterium sp. SORGH_AS_0969]MDQ1114520.1 hypothetical protein [Microbacterium testaceum]